VASVNEVVSEFNIGFFSTTNNNKEHLNLDNLKDSEFADFQGTMQMVNNEPYNPVRTREIDGVRFEQVDGKTYAIPTKLTVNMEYQDQFLDKNGNWDEEAEYASYKEKELAYKKDVINDWLKERGYDLQNSADLMKPLLEKVG
jgi:hypothetical protein